MGGRKLFVEVANASNLMPKDGQGSANAYCVIEFDGQRQQTEVRQKDLNPSWNIVLEFTISDVQSMEAQVLHITLFNTKRPSQREPSFLGRVRIRGANFSKPGEEALVYYKLKRRSLLSQVKGEIGLKVWWMDEPDPPPPEEAPTPLPPAEAPPEAAPPAEAETALAPANEAAPEAAAPPPEPAPEAAPPAEPTPEAPPADPPAEPAPPAAAESSPPEAPASEAPPPEPAAAEAEAAPAAPAAAEEAKPPEEVKDSEEEKKEEEAVKDTREDERIEVIEKAMMMKLQPVYWDHNQPYACEVPWNNFIVSSFLDNPYVNLPLQEECCFCCH